MMTQLHTHSCLVQGVARPESVMNVYGPASPFILQALEQGTMCTPQGDVYAAALNLLD